ncbi:hypothetical protein BBO99_00008908 [Phytophthora kernoviae]|uniref:Proteasome assembly chaperone 1 n=2 Tax=Phytophthora kernoviae TaxID=325452 RepID=A0A3R7HD93_9STRA|nr:hypothetical protein G195_011052 [Phytophthora kernoviae 00238/432]KAG2505769.1 hypothetical protein JM16_009232 [Phytophthora kernoviae]KAG2507253.1 hypothetical protein JM18_008809 [Phytophthora kernoviae]RLN44744.1 hypothetical protein BBI17_008927 [Phytophthora kernoviae]RLN74487.1 hypothetical protein BBO99_00008908 [Phytophthora kernoviae]
MALALRFAEEGEFSSRACDISSLEMPDVAPSKALFRWSKPVRNFLGPAVHAVPVETLIVAMPGAAQLFVQELASSWETVGTLIATDQTIANLTAPSAGILLSKKGVKVSESGNTLALLVGQEVPVQGTWSWLNKLLQHVDAQDVVCLDSHLSTIYDDQSATEPGPQLRMLASSAVSNDMKLSPSVRPLEIPQFVAGISAALLTHGELRKRRVRVFVSLRDVSALPGDVMRSFLPLTASPSSVLGALERPLFYQPSSDAARQVGANASLNVLYT